MRKMIIAILALCALAGAAQAASTASYRIGAVLPLSGLFGKDGAQIKDAYAFWAEHVNAQGGVLAGGRRHPVELVIYDDASTPQRSQLLVRKLATADKVDLLLGGYGSSLVMAASAAGEALGYPMISGGASSNNLFERGYKYYFSTLGRATDEVSGVVQTMAGLSPKPKTCAIIGSDIPFTALACQGYRDQASAAGLEVVHYELFPLALQDYNTVLAKAKASGADVLLVGSHLQVALRVMRAMKEIDYSPKAVAFSYGPTVPAFVQELGPDAEGVFAASEWTPNLPHDGPVFGSAAQFAAAYRQRFGREPDYVEAAAVAGAVAQQLAVQELGLTPPIDAAGRRAIMEKLHAMDVMTFYGRIKFDADGANVAHPPVCVQVQDGKLACVYPPSARTAPPRYPMKPWRQR